MSLLEFIESQPPQNDRVTWVNSGDLKPGKEWTGRVLAVKDVKIVSKKYGTKPGKLLLIESEDGTVYGFKYPYRMFTALIDFVQPERDDMIRIKYLGTVSQQQILNPELYRKLKEKKFRDDVKLFDIEIIQKAPPSIEEVKEQLSEGD